MVSAVHVRYHVFKVVGLLNESVQQQEDLGIYRC